MVITDASPRRKSMIALYIDGEFAVNVDKETFVISKFSVGSEISDDEFYELTRTSDERRAREKALYLIEHRDHSSKELFDKIRRNSSEDAANKAVLKMQELGLVDDEKFARKYIVELIERKKFAARRVEYSLIQKGIDKDFAKALIDEYFPDTNEQLLDLIRKKYQKYLNDEKGVRKTINSLRRLGYAWEDIRSALDEAKENLDQE